MPRDSLCPVATLLFLLAPPCSFSAPHQRPVIGLFPSDDVENGYIPWVEQWNATVLVLPSFAPTSKVESIFQSVNALLLPGVTMGAADGASFESELIQRALDANMAGDYFPVWGTCLGFETLLRYIGGDDVLQGGFDSVDYPTSLTLTNSSPGRVLAGANTSLLEWVQTENVTYNNHGYGIGPQNFAASANLSAFFDVTATSVDRTGQPMVELVEGRTVPIYGSQFHNEKVQFVPEGGQMQHIPKSARAKAFAAYMGEFFVEEARKNKHDTTTATSLVVS
jgi:gamma-glutamyl hydrolase